MAEIIGIVSAGFGIAAFALQVSGSNRALRDARKLSGGKAAEELDIILHRLEGLHRALDCLGKYDEHPVVRIIVQNCSTMYAGIETSLLVLMAKLPDKSTDDRQRWKSLKLAFSREVKEEIKEVQGRI